MARKSIIESLLGLCLAGWLLAAGCGYEIDTTRHPAARGSFGEELHLILARDLDRDQPDKGRAFGAERERFVRAVDRLMPEELLDDLQAWLEQSLPLYDTGRMQAVLRPAACKLEAELAQDRELLAALEYMRRPHADCDDAILLPVLQRILQREDTDELLDSLGGLFLAHDGLGAGQEPDPGEDDTFAVVLGDLSVSLAASQIELPDPQSTAALLADWLLEEDPRLAPEGEQPEWISLLDPRGRARVAPDPSSGEIPEPFADLDSDGLADIDPLRGDFVDAQGEPIDAPSPCGPEGRTVYLQRDLVRSRLAALLDQLEPLVADGLLWELPTAARALLGPLAPLADEDGLYTGYATDDAALFALAHALLAIADYDRLPQLLDAVVVLLEQREAFVARLLHELDKAGEVTDLYPQTLEDHNRLVDDLVPHLQEFAERGYVLDFFRSFADSRWLGLQAGLADMIRYRYVQPANCGQADCTSGGCGCDYEDYDGSDDRAAYLRDQRPTDFSLPDNTYANRSNLQRGLHLIHDANGVRHSMSVLGWEPFPIEDMLVFYIDSAAGDEQAGLVEVAWYVEAAVTEFTSSTPPAEEVSRFMVHDHSVLGNPLGAEGFEIRNYNGEALLAFKHSGALDSLRPVYAAIAQRDRELARSGTKVLAELMAALHPHYSCNLPHASPACAHIRPLEPMLLEVLDSTDALTALVDLLRSVQGLRTAQGGAVDEELARFVHFLLEPDPALLRHDGSGSVAAADGLTPVYPISRFYLLLDALRFADDAVQAVPGAEQAFERACDLVWDQLLQVEGSGEDWRFTNRRGFLLVLAALDFLADRARVQVQAGQLSARLAEIEDELAADVSGRVLPRLIEAWALVADEPGLPARLDALCLDLLDRDEGEKAQELRRLAGWGLQYALVDRITVPLGHSLARHLDPEADGWDFVPGTGCLSVPASRVPRANLRFLSRAIALVLDLASLDGNGRDVLATLLTNAAAETEPLEGAWTLDDLIEVLAEVHRCEPGAGGLCDADDAACVLSEIADFMLDDARGLERVYVMIERRDGYEPGFVHPGR
ncbi:MAG: hypothetical protein JXR96_15235 [Deltaproteobacteria bacterium]|nr:hypothetical protein [Deltaproteobacteria bacterium]